jgi:hypothetical protein
MLVVHAVTWHIGRPLGGFIPHRGPGDESQVYAMPTSMEAARYRGDRTLLLLRINGRDTCETPTGPHCGQDWARSLIDTTPGAQNRFVVRAVSEDRADTVVLAAAPGELQAVLSWAHYNLVLTLLGLVYAVVRGGVASPSRRSGRATVSALRRHHGLRPERRRLRRYAHAARLRGGLVVLGLADAVPVSLRA